MDWSGDPFFLNENHVCFVWCYSGLAVDRCLFLPCLFFFFGRSEYVFLEKGATVGILFSFLVIFIHRLIFYSGIEKPANRTFPLEASCYLYISFYYAPHSTLFPERVATRSCAFFPSRSRGSGCEKPLSNPPFQDRLTYTHLPCFQPCSTTHIPLSPLIPISNPIIPPSLPPTGMLLPTLHPAFLVAISLCPFSRSASDRLIIGGKGRVVWRERVRGMVRSGG